MPGRLSDLTNYFNFNPLQTAKNTVRFINDKLEATFANHPTLKHAFEGIFTAAGVYYILGYKEGLFAAVVVGGGTGALTTPMQTLQKKYSWGEIAIPVGGAAIVALSGEMFVHLTELIPFPGPTDEMVKEHVKLLFFVTGTLAGSFFSQRNNMQKEATPQNTFKKTL